MKAFLITGSSRGLGRSLAEAALASGQQVVAAVRRPEAVADLVERYPDTALAVELDVTDAGAAERAVAAAVERFGRLDVVVNNAGYANVSSIEDTSLEDFRAQVETNVWGAIHVSKAALPALRAQGSGHILQVSSVSGRLAPAPGLGAYVTAKFALEGFSEALALEAAPFGVRVTIVQPGAVATTLASSMSLPEPSTPYRDVVAPMRNLYGSAPAGGLGADPEKVAQSILAVLELADPPLRLALSGDAVDYIRDAGQRSLAELDRWEALSRTVDA
ncbi:SDR family NAD(P)-dependent oxidoreductase [Streptomyces sp. NPDC005195]|uniref:SDR family NAD(P)-dependent oxidoreductase n=1 Tax=Streptomyces sp. NPDC005195 TaxID=3154561 RepID=UPI0033BE1939